MVCCKDSRRRGPLRRQQFSRQPIGAIDVSGRVQLIEDPSRRAEVASCPCRRTLVTEEVRQFEVNATHLELCADPPEGLEGLGEQRLGFVQLSRRQSNPSEDTLGVADAEPVAGAWTISKPRRASDCAFAASPASRHASASAEVNIPCHCANPK